MGCVVQVQGNDAGQAAAVGRLTARARLEILPFASVEAQLAELGPGTRITVTCSPRHGIEHTLAFSETWAERRLDVVPHIAARMVKSSAHAGRIADRVRASGFAEVFVIGGDHSPPDGPYTSAVTLLKDLAPLLPGVRIGIPGYPEGHPLIGSDVLDEALAAKQAYAATVITQLCFDPDTIKHWIQMVRAQGVTLPVLVGVPGVVERKRLLELSARVGVGASTRYLRKNLRSATRLLLHAYEPDGLVAELEALQSAEPALGITGLHVFTFNQVAATEAWLRADLTGEVTGV